ncbi:hypothetical protein GCM10027271_31050 [Saccharopolyspora gloriosae]
MTAAGTLVAGFRATLGRKQKNRPRGPGGDVMAQVGDRSPKVSAPTTARAVRRSARHAEHLLARCGARERYPDAVVDRFVEREPTATESLAHAAGVHLLGVGTADAVGSASRCSAHER